MENSNNSECDPQDELDNMKIKFNEKMKEYSNKSNEVVKKPWTNASVEEAIRELLSSNNPGKKKTSKQYRLTRKYDTMDVSGKKVLIKKRRSKEDPVIVIVPVEEYFDMLLQYHCVTGHGGRDKILFALKNKFYITRPAVEIFVSLCRICNTKKSQQNRNIVAGQTTTKDFNLRSQLDLIDFQSTPCGDYKWLMHYQDHATKYCILRPLKKKCASEVALELLKVFLDFGAPKILQSNNVREFTTDVIQELSTMWPDCKIIHGIIECCNQDIENMLRAWMEDNRSIDWVIGCRFVQWQQNSSENRIIGRNPYTALFGAEPKIGLGSMNILPTISSEKDLDIINIAKEREENQTADLEKEICSICSRILNKTSSVSCYLCSMKNIKRDKIRSTCYQSVASTFEKNNTDYYYCAMCNKQEKIIKQRQKLYKGQKRTAEKIIETTGKKLKPVAVQDFVLLKDLK